MTGWADDDGTAGARRLEAAGASVGVGVRAWIGPDLEVSESLRIGDGATVVADELRLGAGTRIGAGADIRSRVVEIGPDSEILDGVRVLVADSFVLGVAGRIEQRVSITCRSFTAGRLFYLGHDSSVGYGGTTASTSHVRIGDRVALGPHNILNANYPIELGDQVGSGCYLSIWTHGFHFGHRLVDGYESAFASVRIEPNVWLGFHVTVLPGVSIGANTILAAGAVASRDLPANVLAGGVPAKPIKPLSARRLEGSEVWGLLEELLGAWCEELMWKGVACERIGPLEARVGGTRVVALPDDAHAPPVAGEEETVLLTLSERSDLHAPVLGRVVFELRGGGLVGSPSPVTHDLRDFLRRNALPCGDGMKFSSLQPEPFARLTNPGRSAVAT